MIVDNIGGIKDLKTKENDKIEELLQIQRDNLNEFQAEISQDPIVIEPDNHEEVIEDVEPQKGPGMVDNSKPRDAIQSENDNSVYEEEEDDQP